MKAILSDIRHPVTKRVKDMNIGDHFIQMDIGTTFYGPYRILEIRNGSRFAINLMNDSVPFELTDEKEYIPVDIETITVKRYWK